MNIKHLDIPAGAIAVFEFDNLYGTVAITHESGDDPVYLRSDGFDPVVKGANSKVILPGSRSTITLRTPLMSDASKPRVKATCVSAATIELEVAGD